MTKHPKKQVATMAAILSIQLDIGRIAESLPSAYVGWSRWGSDGWPPRVEQSQTTTRTVGRPTESVALNNLDGKGDEIDRQRQTVENRLYAISRELTSLSYTVSQAGSIIESADIARGSYVKCRNVHGCPEGAWATHHVKDEKARCHACQGYLQRTGRDRTKHGAAKRLTNSTSRKGPTIVK
jgi:hypothetical protein